MSAVENAARQRLLVSLVVNRPGAVRERAKLVWRQILEYEIESGTRFLSTKPDSILFIILGPTRQLMTLPRQGRGGDKIFAYLHELYGLGERDDITRHVYDAMRGWAISHGERVEMRRLSAFDVATRTAYVSDYAGGMWKITGEEITGVANGEDNIFFANDDGGTPTPIDVAPHGILFDTMTDLNFMEGLGGITGEQQRMAMITWMFALCLPDLMPTKPLLLIEGTRGSGKSSAVLLLQLMLTGAVKPLILSKNKEDAFGILLLRSPIAMLDNLDNYIDWLADAVCSYTTLGVFPRRKLYSDDEEVVIKPHAFLAVTTRNPSSFRRDDVADRSLILRLDRRPGFRRFQALQADVLAQRPRLLGEFLYYLNLIVREIRNGALEEAPEDETHRMADFAALARVVGRVLEWEVDAIAAMMNALQDERDAFINEEDPLVELLHKWIVYRPKGNSNIGRDVPLANLFAELESLAQIDGIEKTWYKTPRALAQNLRSSHVAKDFVVELHGNGGHKSYRIWRHTDPRLEIVPGGLSLIDEDS